ncbi:MAG: acyltransferase family protein [Halioglobus sp.]
MPKAEQRLHGLDFLRALMMLLGVVLHTAQMYMTLPITDYYVDSMRSVSMDAILIYINTFRMPTFYLLSGFFTALLFSRRGLGGMIKNRYQRLFIPFIIFLPLLAITMTALRIVAENIMATGHWGFDISHVQTPRKLWDNTHNLWFLYYLMMYVLTAVVLIKISVYLPESARASFRRILQLPIFSPMVIVVVSLWLAALGSASFSGRLSGSLHLMPELTVFGYFGASFLLGWMLYQRLDDLDTLAARAWQWFILANITLVVGLLFFATQGEQGDGNYAALHGGLSVATGFSMMFFMLGFVGLFSRYFATYNPWIRYVSDSAYWVFILHSVPMVAIAMLLHDVQVAAGWKFLIVGLSTFAICLLTYQLWVRNSVVGQLLNGRRYTESPFKKTR